MAHVGFSPPTRVFEAAGAGACLITDAWQGIESFFEPQREILVAHSAADLVGLLTNISAPETRDIGMAMRRRALRDHTYRLRAEQVHAILQASGVSSGRYLEERDAANSLV
jgi:spore maturation protein CgeB